MVALITVSGSDGVEGRCDANCYDAKHPHCTCCCGGANHGAGLDKAIANTREMVEGWVGEAKFAEIVQQIPLTAVPA